MVICAVALVGLVTVTGPGWPSVPPPTDVPGPNVAIVVPCTKCVYAPIIATCNEIPALPLLGDTLCRVGTPLIVRANGLDAFAVALSVTVAVKFQAPAVAGTPLICPLAAFKLKPVG